MPLGVTTLRDLITYRPAVRDTCLRWLLEFSGHTGTFLYIVVERSVIDSPSNTYV